VIPEQDARASYERNGYLHVQGVFTPTETDELAGHLDRLIQEWSFEAAWTGPWREAYVHPDMAGSIRLSALHDLQLGHRRVADPVPRPGGVANTVVPERNPFVHVPPLSVVVAHPRFDEPPSVKRPLWNAATSVDPKENVSGSTWVAWKLVEFV